MQQYRLYKVSRVGILGPPEVLLAFNDREAIRMVVEHQPESVMGVEIWDGDRLVALVPIESKVSEIPAEPSPLGPPVSSTHAGPLVTEFEIAAAPPTEA
jgi:hypothetical protein